MSSDSLRAALRHHTEATHRRIDEAAGALGGVDQYRAFLVNSYRFRGSVEPGCVGIGFWSTPLQLGLLARDLQDLATKYAYGGRPGRVSIRLEQQQTHLRLCVSDSGKAIAAAARGPASAQGCWPRWCRAWAGRSNAATISRG